MVKWDEIQTVKWDAIPEMSVPTPEEKPKASWTDFSPGALFRGAKEAVKELPMVAGMTAGGMVAGPVGAAAGAVAGKSVQNIVGGTVAAIKGKPVEPLLTTLKKQPSELAGAATEGAMYEIGGAAAGRALTGTMSALPGVVKKIMSNVFGPSVKAIEARLADPAAIQNAKTSIEIAQKMPQVINKIDEMIARTDGIAWDKLSSEPTISQGVVKVTLDKIKAKIGNPVTPADNKLLANIATIEKNLFGESTVMPTKVLGPGGKPAGTMVKQTRGALGDKVSEKQFKELVQRLDKDINWDQPGAARYNEILTEARIGIDQYLKRSNPEYRKAMEPVAGLMDARGRLKTDFLLQEGVGKGVTPGNVTVTKIENAWKERNIATQKLLEDTRKLTGIDIGKEISDSGISREFMKPTTHGSRNAVTGAAVGTAAGHFTGIPGASYVGGAGGAVLGRQIDTQGGKMAADIIDKYSKHAAKFGKYGKILKQAAEISPKALTVTYIALRKKDPEFNAIVNNLDRKIEIPTNTAPNKQAIYNEEMGRYLK